MSKGAEVPDAHEAGSSAYQCSSAAALAKSKLNQSIMVSSSGSLYRCATLRGTGSFSKFAASAALVLFFSPGGNSRPYIAESSTIVVALKDSASLRFAGRASTKSMRYFDSSASRSCGRTPPESAGRPAPSSRR
jgi:hypothetical protein